MFIRSSGKVALIDADHIGGVPAVLQSFPVRSYVDNGVPARIDAYREASRLVEELGITYLDATARAITLGDASLKVLGLPLERDPTDQNNTSVGIVVEYGTFKALLTGDSQVAELSAWLAQIDVPDVDVLKAGHHGSTNGLTPEWLERTAPEVVVITIGRNNAYGHPEPWALEQYRGTGAHIYRTDLDGEITVLVCTGDHYVVATAAANEEPRSPCPQSPLQKRGP